jgi:hypothetical protein
MTNSYPPDLPPEIHFSWGVTGVGACARCQDIRTLIVHSAIHTADECEPLCLECLHSALTSICSDARSKMWEFEQNGARIEDTPEYQVAKATYDTYYEVIDVLMMNRARIQHTREEVRH